ncbi:DinB family protein [Lutibacter citreus]|uniref:DinB family protein n=1 Tax=Lutibacter citreus TaxID=2138210 RepID=UPI000DBE2635|nr:DinB family protein [Lutibacter citreus]
MNSVKLSENEYAPFYGNYIKVLGEIELQKALKSSLKNLIKTIEVLPEEKLAYRYDDGKWTIKELIQHLIDTERILSYRALRFSRNDASEILGFNENWYVDNSNGNNRNINDLLKEFKLVRKSTIALFKSFPVEMFTRQGTANGSDMTVRALGFIIAGHQTHHLNIIKEKYI